MEEHLVISRPTWRRPAVLAVFISFTLVLLTFKQYGVTRKLTVFAATSTSLNFPAQQHVWDAKLISTVQELLQGEVQAIGRQYAGCPVCGGNATTALQLLQRHVHVNAITGSLAQHMMSTYQNRTQLMLAVTGGSSSCSYPGWHQKLLQRLKGVLLPQVELRNAAQGSTSQLVTAPCIQTLVGNDVDLLFWEFAMNDEYPNIVMAHTSERVRVAEAWIRMAARLRPKALGFLHYHDLDMRHWTPGQQNPPDKAWVPTNYAADHVLKGQGIDGFSVNMFAILTSGLVAINPKKEEFLADAHHPNDMAFSITADALKLGILTVWQQGLEVLVGTRQAPLLQEQPQPLLQPGLLLPSLDQSAACYLTSTPQFGSAEPTLLLQGCASYGAAGQKCEIVPYGKAAANRQDRKAILKVPVCGSAEHDKSGLTFAVNSTQLLTSLWLSCGAQNPCQGLTAYLDGIQVQPDVSTGGDMISYFYPWVLNITSTPFEHAKMLRLCRNASVGAADLFVGRLLVWMQG